MTCIHCSDFSSLWYFLKAFLILLILWNLSSSIVCTEDRKSLKQQFDESKSMFNSCQRHCFLKFQSQFFREILARIGTTSQEYESLYAEVGVKVEMQKNKMIRRTGFLSCMSLKSVKCTRNIENASKQRWKFLWCCRKCIKMASFLSS